jgi:peptidoglycan biosynthesis protein MviN/MurJ (putative lipid II flippase)
MIGITLGALMGVIYARCLSGLFGMVLNMRLVRDFTGLTLIEQFSPNLRALCSTAAMIAITLLAGQMAAGAGETGDLLIQIVAMMSAGVVSYLALTIVLWMIAGRPEGLERDLIAAVFRKQRPSADCTSASPSDPDLK